MKVEEYGKVGNTFDYLEMSDFVQNISILYDIRKSFSLKIYLYLEELHKSITEQYGYFVTCRTRKRWLSKYYWNFGEWSPNNALIKNRISILINKIMDKKFTIIYPVLKYSDVKDICFRENTDIFLKFIGVEKKNEKSV
jgi:hypothetical protein